VALSQTFEAFKADLTALLEDEWGTGTISGLVNNAGFGGGHAFAQMSEDAFDRYYQVLLRARTF
jgi:NAD(P)-dependent dehydrogenase (short-subunit alcohol dehydrogenase family)